MQKDKFVPVESAEIEVRLLHHTEHASQISKKSRGKPIIVDQAVPLPNEGDIWQRQDASLGHIIVRTTWLADTSTWSSPSM